MSTHIDSDELGAKSVAKKTLLLRLTPVGSRHLGASAFGPRSLRASKL